MKINKIEVDDTRSIVIIDDAFKFSELQDLYNACMTLNYKCTNTSFSDIQDIPDRRLRADLPQINMEKFMSQTQEGVGLRRSLCPDCGRKETLETDGQANIPDDRICAVLFNNAERMANFNQIINPNDFEFDTVYANLGLCNDDHGIHVDHPKPNVGYTMLIYPNIEWKANWGGETAFYEEDCEEMIYLNPYKPGRICIFDGSIPHCAKPQALIGAKFRFTIAVKFASLDFLAATGRGKEQEAIIPDVQSPT
tara:strand:+ start:1529 stop:2284 length:756 start_codon:yes stop_codon:yes gene_type:complete